MNVTLHEDDAFAVDLLLDRVATTGTDGPLFAARPADPGRVTRVERVLGMLRWMPDADPPTDLVSRTLEYCDGSTGSDHLSCGGVHFAPPADHRHA